LKIEATQQENKKTDITAIEGSDALPERATGESVVAQAGIQLAYDDYLKARKRLANAFKGREFQDREAYINASWRYRIYEKAMEKAVKDREKAEREALNIYLNTVDKALLHASEEFRDRMIQALRECRHKTEQAWQASIETSADMTYVFQNDVSIPVTEEEDRVQLQKKVNKGNNTAKKLLEWKNGFSALFRHNTKSQVRKSN
jgi:hypothetical protein